MKLSPSSSKLKILNFSPERSIESPRIHQN